MSSRVRNGDAAVETLDLLGGANRPPPIPAHCVAAMSLKARENASLSLKRIFDQMNQKTHHDMNVNLELAATGNTHIDPQPAPKKMVKSPSESNLQAYNTPDVARAAAFQALQTHKMKQQLEGILLSRRAKGHQPPLACHAPHAATSRMPTIAAQPKAQLTIFYSGVVNVFDDVPADKAHAIMLLATGNASSTSNVAAMAPTTSAAPTPMLASTAAGATHSQALSTSTPCASLPFTFSTPPASPFPGEIKQSLVKRSHTELPFARKASLVRFFERRKERLQGQAISEDSGKDGVMMESEEICEEGEARAPKRLCPSSPDDRQG